MIFVNLCIISFRIKNPKYLSSSKWLTVLEILTMIGFLFSAVQPNIIDSIGIHKLPPEQQISFLRNFKTMWWGGNLFLFLFCFMYINLLKKLLKFTNDK